MYVEKYSNYDLTLSYTGLDLEGYGSPNGASTRPVESDFPTRLRALKSNERIPTEMVNP